MRRYGLTFAALKRMMEIHPPAEASTSRSQAPNFFKRRLLCGGLVFSHAISYQSNFLRSSPLVTRNGVRPHDWLSGIVDARPTLHSCMGSRGNRPRCKPDYLLR